MRYRAIVWTVLIWLVGAFPAASAAAGSATVVWLDAPGYEAAVTALGNAGPVSPDSGGLVFTSEDYQKLLLVPHMGKSAFIFDLKKRELASIARASVSLGDDGGASIRGAASPLPLGPFVVNKAGLGTPRRGGDATAAGGAFQTGACRPQCRSRNPRSG